MVSCKRPRFTAAGGVRQTVFYSYGEQKTVCLKQQPLAHPLDAESDKIVSPLRYVLFVVTGTAGAAAVRNVLKQLKIEAVNRGFAYADDQPEEVLEAAGLKKYSELKGDAFCDDPKTILYQSSSQWNIIVSGTIEQRARLVRKYVGDTIYPIVEQALDDNASVIYVLSQANGEAIAPTVYR